jgi:predicted metal-dependent HD superfamily phosphohydrolase
VSVAKDGDWGLEIGDYQPANPQSPIPNLTLLLTSLRATTEQGQALWLDVVARYGENGRFYHTLPHIQHVLILLAPFANQVRDWTALQLAAWYHDIIYDPRASNNEEQSAAYATAVLRPLALPPATLNRVQQLILATKNHQAPPNDTDAQLLLDADLAILAANQVDYTKYAWAIRQEYGFVPEAAYRQGRTAVLHHFLSRPQLYHHLTHLEQPARANLHWEIARLGEKAFFRQD